MTSRVWMGDNVAEVSLPGGTSLQARAALLRASGAFVDVVVGAQSIGVSFRPETTSHADVERHLNAVAGVSLEDSHRGLAVVHRLPVEYGGAGGPDLRHVADILGLTEQALIDLHQTAVFEVKMIGFTPGFAYLKAPEFAGDVARLDVPRRMVSAGSIGIAAGLCGVYALQGPGGWPLIGRVVTPLFDGETAPYFRLSPGEQVRFEAAEACG